MHYPKGLSSDLLLTLINLTGPTIMGSKRTSPPDQAISNLQTLVGTITDTIIITATTSGIRIIIIITTTIIITTITTTTTTTIPETTTTTTITTVTVETGQTRREKLQRNLDS